MRLKKISLLRERITKPREYPFYIPAIASLNALEISSRICFFVGENGTGKSTLLEAIAAHYGFGLEGGNRNGKPSALSTAKAGAPRRLADIPSTISCKRIVRGGGLMVDEATAKTIAAQEINRTYQGEFGPLVILGEHTIEKEYGWIFFYSTQRYAETGDIQYALAGNGPLIVERSDGAVHRFGASRQPDVIIREFELDRGYSGR